MKTRGGFFSVQMRTYKIVLLVTSLVLSVVGAYSAFMYVYTENMFSPVPLLIAPYKQDFPASHLNTYTRFIHRVNTPRRAQKKDKYFIGFEVDVWAQDEKFLAAHDEQEAQNQTSLDAIFKAVQDPAQKRWWLDLKQELSSAQLDELLQLAMRYQIPVGHLLFEVSDGPTAELLKQRGLNMLLQLPEGFDTDGKDPARREQLNAQVLALWEKYHPVAVSASFGKYGYLRAYFPHMPKAIYYSATVRPSIKKSFMAARMQKDPSVKIFMTEQYTWLNL